MWPSEEVSLKCCSSKYLISEIENKINTYFCAKNFKRKSEGIKMGLKTCARWAKIIFNKQNSFLLIRKYRNIKLYASTLISNKSCFKCRHSKDISQITNIMNVKIHEDKTFHMSVTNFVLPSIIRLFQKWFISLFDFILKWNLNYYLKIPMTILFRLVIYLSVFIIQ